MTIPSRKCFLINHIILIIHGVSCAKLGEMLVGVDKNTTETNPIQNDTSTKFHELAENDKAIGNSKENLESNKTITNSINTNNEIPAITNANLISRLKNTTPNIINIRVIHGGAKTTDSKGNSKDKTTILGNLKPLMKSKRNRRYDFNNKTPPPKSELQPEGYIYDLNNCQYVDNRVLCGYDKNPQPPQRKEVVDLDDLCKKHGDRIECGYVTGPFPDAYNPDPEKDKIAKINLSDYKNVARSALRNGDNDNDVDMALRMGNVPIVLLSEVLKLRSDMANLIAALPADTKFTFGTDSTTPTLNTIPATTTATSTSAPTTKVTKENSDINATLSEILKSEAVKLTLASFMTPSTTTIQTENTNEKKCVEKDGRIFCRTV